ncbi:DUF4347 domain-containing protein [Pseudomonas sp. ALS1131]|nr:Ig-like domain-containing protein [Pseudomonas sp. ALS1131]TRO42173.1 DUF4347 domain-containing protein [Pseudomonas sp. ALS1131]
MFWNKKKTAAVGSASVPARSPLASALEPRMMFDGAIAASVAETAITAADATHTQTADDNAQNASDAVTPPAASSDQRQEIVFVDGKVQNYQQLVSEIKPGTEVVVLDGTRDGLQQIADYLKDREGIDAIHILSHGAEAQLQLGSLALDRSNLASHANTLAAIGESLSDDGDILLYGCDVAATDSGIAFIQSLAYETDADVAASSNKTGSSVLGGDWQLESQNGVIESAVLFAESNTREWQNLLASLPTTPGGVTYAEGTDVDTRTWNGVGRDTFKLDETGAYTFTGSISSPGDPTDVIPIEIPTGAYINSYTLTISNQSYNYGAQLYIENMYGTFARSHSLTSQTQTDDIPAGMYSFYIGHGNMAGLDYSLTLNVVALPANTVPTATNLTQGVTVTEGGSTVALSDIVITDPDASDTLTATLTLSSPAAGALSTGTFGSATSSYNPGTGVWSVTGSRTDVNAALAAVALTPSADNDQNFTITTRIRDAANSGPADGIISVSVTGVNDVPSATNLNQSKAVTEGGGAVALDDIVVSDPDTGDTITATLTLSSPAAGSLSTGTFGAASSTYDAGTGVWTVSGSRVDVNAALAAVALTPSADNEQNFTIATRIRDAANSGPADGSITISVTAVNDAPVVSTSGGNSSFIENAGGSVIDTSLTLSDVDNATLASARVAITGNFASDQDVLAFVNDGSMGNISASYDAGTGVLTLTSASASATLAQWQAALRSVTYSNGSDAPSTAARTISFRVNDGTADSNLATKVLNVSAVNDAPQITAPATLSVTEDQASVLTGISFSDPDSGANPVTAIFSVPSGMLTATSGGAVTVLGSGSSSLTLTGTLANVNAFIAGNKLSYTTAANATANVTLSIGINDGSAANDSRTVALQVTAVNDAPSITAPPFIDVTEDVGSALTSISFADPDAGSNTVTATFSVPSGTLSATSSGSVTVWGTSSALTLSGSLAHLNAFIAAGQLSFQTAANATANVVLSISINDGALTDSTTLTLAVTAVNDAPVNNVPGAQTAQQNIALGFNTANGNAISITDVDAGNGLMTVTLTATNGTLSLGSLSSITLLQGTGTNDASMKFEGNSANINAALQTLSFKSSSSFHGAASLTIETNDNGNSDMGGAKTDVDTISINVIPVNPKVTSVSAQGLDRTVKIGDEVLINVVFDQVVNADTSGGIPSLLLETGLVDRDAVYLSGSGSNTLVFKYTVQAGDLSADLDFQSSAALQLNGAVLANASNDLAVLTLPTVGGSDSLGGRSNIVVDGVVPVVGSVQAPTDGTYITGQNLDFTVNFSEAITVDTTGGTPRLAITLDTGGTVYASYLSGSGSNALVFRHTLDSGVQDTNGISLAGSIDSNSGQLRDGAGNLALNTLNGVAATTGVLVDSLPPTASIVVADTALRIGETATVTVTFNEAVFGLSTADFSVANGTLSNLASGDDGITWTATLTPNANVTDASNLITLDNTGYTDAAGNTGSGSTDSNSYSIDTQRPSATLVVADSTLKAGQSTTVTITFSEAVTGLGIADFSVANGALSNLSTSDNITYTATLTPNANVTDTTNLITLDNTGYTDAAGNTGSGSTDSNNYAIDSKAPAVTSVGVPANGTYLAGDHLDFAVNFDEAVTVDTSGGTPRLAITLDTGGTVYASYVSGSGTSALVFRLTVVDGQMDSNGISLGNSIDANGGTLRDVAGNDTTTTLNTVGSTTGVLVDAVVPEVSAISLDGASPTNATSVTFTVTFSEDVSGVDINDFSLITSGSVNATLQSLVQIDPRTYQVTVDAITGLGSLGLNLNANGTGIVDAASNAITGGFTDGPTYAIDTNAPTAPVVTSPALTNAPTPMLSGTAEAGSTVTVTIGGATYTTVASGGAWSLDLATATPAAGSLALNTNGANPVSVTATDTAGNVSSATTQPLVIDTTAPSVPTLTSPALTNAPAPMLSGTAEADSTVTVTIGGATYTIVASGGAWSLDLATATPAAGSLALDTNGANPVSVTATDAAGNVSSATTQTLVIDTTAPSVPTLTSPALTNAPAPMLSGTAEAGSTVTVTIGGATYTTVASGGAWSLDLATATPAAGSLALNTNGANPVSVTATDTAGNVSSAGSQTLIIDTQAPTIGSVTVPVGVHYNAGDTLTFVVNASEAVLVNGTPRLALDVGGVTVFADYVAGSSTSTLVFQYSVQAGLNDADGITVVGLVDNGGSIQDAAGNVMDPTLNNVGDTSGVIIDTTAPSVSAIVTLDPSPTNAGSVRYSVVFSENVSGVDLADFSLVTTGNVAASLGSLVQIDSRTYQVTINGITGSGTLALALNASGTAIVDAAGNELATGLVGSAYSLGQNEGDPEFRANPPSHNVDIPSPPLQPTLPSLPPPPTTSPLLPPPLFEVPTLGSGIPTLGNIFITQNPLAPSYIAQVFASSSDSGGNGSGIGFLGFGGGDGGVFGSSSLSGIFGKEVRQEGEQLEVFDGKKWGAGNGGGLFGAPTLGQQLHDLHETEQRQHRELALALQQIAAAQPPA